MKRRSITIPATLAFLLLFPLTAFSQIQLTWKVLKYDLVCQLPADYTNDRSIAVTANLKLRNQTDRPFNRVTLRISEAAKISSANAGGATIDFAVGIEKLSETQNLQKVELRVPSVPAGGSVELALNYKITAAANSGLNAISPISSQFLPFSFWYPTPTRWYFPEGDDHAPVDITVNGLNGRQLVAAGKGSGTKFSSLLRGMPFFAVGKWNESEHEGVSVYTPASDSVVPGRAAEMAAIANASKAFVEERIGKKIEEPLKIVAVARGAGFSGSGVIFVERGAFMTHSLDSKTVISISEAIAKTMIGNVVTVGGAGIRCCPGRPFTVYFKQVH